MGSPVCGLRPMRALRCTFFRRPSPGTTKRPFFLVSLTAVSVKCSRKVAAVLLFVPTFSAKWRTSWVLVMPEAMIPPLIEKFNFPAISASYTIAPVEKQLQTLILGGFFSRQGQKAATNQGFSAADSPEAPFWRSAAPFPLDIGWGLTRSFNSSTRRRNPRLCHNLSRRSIPVSCAICDKRKEKRFCPAVHGRICPQCCGEQREVTLDCPSDCGQIRPCT